MIAGVASKRLLAVAVLVSGCTGSKGGGAESLSIEVDGNDQVVVGAWVHLLAYIPGEGYQDLQDVAWTWTIESAPTGSAIALQAANDSLIEVAPDLPGFYLFRVEGHREGGGSGEATAIVQAYEFGVGLVVRLEWNTPSNDVDLHLVNLTEGGVFRTAPFDCYYANGNPDWPPDGPSGDPQLDLDDVNGYGPENIAVTETIPAVYRVYAHYFSDDALGATDATVEIGLLDAALYSDTQTLPQTGALWVVADVDTGLGSVTPIDVLTNDTAAGFARASK